MSIHCALLFSLQCLFLNPFWILFKCVIRHCSCVECQQGEESVAFNKGYILANCWLFPQIYLWNNLVDDNMTNVVYNYLGSFVSRSYRNTELHIGYYWRGIIQKCQCITKRFFENSCLVMLPAHGYKILSVSLK